MLLDNFKEKDKIIILINLLNERYKASHQMRDRSLKFAMWILGFIIIAIPWLLFHNELFIRSIRWILTFLVITIGTLTFWLLRAIHFGFKKNWECVIKIEEALGCYKRGLFINSKQLFPEEYKNTKKTSLRHHFVLIYLWIFIAIITTILFIWFSPS